MLVLRTWRGLSGKELADRLGISKSMVSQMEKRGKVGSTRTLCSLARILDVSLDLLVELL